MDPLLKIDAMTFSPCTIPAPRGLPHPCTPSSSSSYALHDGIAFLGGRISSNSSANLNHKSSHLHPTFSSPSKSEQEAFPSTSCSYSTLSSSVSQCNKGRALAWSASSLFSGPFLKKSRSSSRMQQSGLKMVLSHSKTKIFQLQHTHFWQCRQKETTPRFLHQFWQSRQIQTRTHFSKPREIRIRATGVASVTAEEENVSRNNSAGTESSSGGKVKASGQLSRWARARKIRAGKLSPTQKKNEAISASVGVQEAVDSSPVDRAVTPEAGEGEDYEGGRYYGVEPEAYEKGVYMISDGTGWTADHSVNAALGQFEHCMVDRRCSVDTHLFSDVNDVDSLMGIIRHAGMKGGMVVYTMADPTMAEAAKEACELLGVAHIDILGPITEALGKHLGVSPLGLSRGAPGRKHTLSKQYFKRIEAVEFTIKQDDGALPKNLHLADIVLAGVSRTSKTPLSTYIAQKGYKVANVPLVFGIDPPKELFNVDQDKVFGLTINANFLKAIRMARYRHLGVAENSSSSYSDMEHIRRELEYSRKLFSQNPRWPVVEVTGKAIEETAAVILRLYHERRHKFSMPRISTRY